MSTVPTNGNASSVVTGALKRRVVVCAGTGCMANGALKVHHALEQAATEAGLAVTVELRAEREADGIHLSKSGCQGFCQMGPLVTILPDNILYTRVKPADVDEIVAALRFIVATPTVTGQTIVLDGGQRFLSLSRDVQFLEPSK